jgi:hypothetical protein
VDEDRHRKTPRLLRWLLLPSGRHLTAAIASLLLLAPMLTDGRPQGVGRREVFAMAAIVAVAGSLFFFFFFLRGAVAGSQCLVRVE